MLRNKLWEIQPTEIELKLLETQKNCGMSNQTSSQGGRQYESKTQEKTD